MNHPTSRNAKTEELKATNSDSMAMEEVGRQKLNELSIWSSAAHQSDINQSALSWRGNSGCGNMESPQAQECDRRGRRDPQTSRRC